MAFASNAGQSLFYRLSQGHMVAVSAGLFDPGDFHLEHEIFIKSKPAYYALANDTTKLTGEEVFAAFENENKDI